MGAGARIERPAGADALELITVGRIAGLYGVRGWLRIHSETDPRDAILEYDPWYIAAPSLGQWLHLEAGRRHGKSLVAKLAGWDDRTDARGLLNAPIAIHRDQLPPAPAGTYYWIDLYDLPVVGPEGTPLGRVSGHMESGAHPIMIVQDQRGREHLIPFVPETIVQRVDWDQRRIEVDWHPDFLTETGG